MQMHSKPVRIPASMHCDAMSNSGDQSIHLRISEHSVLDPIRATQFFTRTAAGVGVVENSDAPRGEAGMIIAAM